MFDSKRGGGRSFPRLFAAFERCGVVLAHFLFLLVDWTGGKLAAQTISAKNALADVAGSLMTCIIFASWTAIKMLAKQC